MRAFCHAFLFLSDHRLQGKANGKLFAAEQVFRRGPRAAAAGSDAGLGIIQAEHGMLFCLQFVAVARVRQGFLGIAAQ